MEVDHSVDVIHASCVLHNICELQKNEFIPDWEEADALEDAVVVEPINEIEAEDADNICSALTEHFA